LDKAATIPGDAAAAAIPVAAYTASYTSPSSFTPPEILP
jgi:hypothetical protein